MDTVAFVQDENAFDTLLADDSLLVVDFTATWCGPCKMVAPLMERLQESYGDRIRVFKVDLDDNRPLGRRFNIKSIPAVMLFKQGELVETLIGVKPYDTFVGAVEKALGS